MLLQSIVTQLSGYKLNSFIKYSQRKSKFIIVTMSFWKYWNTHKNWRIKLTTYSIYRSLLVIWYKLLFTFLPGQIVSLFVVRLHRTKYIYCVISVISQSSENLFSTLPFPYHHTTDSTSYAHSQQLNILWSLCCIVIRLGEACREQ